MVNVLENYGGELMNQQILEENGKLMNLICQE